MNAMLLLAAISLYKIDPYWVNPHMHDAKPDDATETSELKAWAARGEFESVSWVACADGDLPKFDVVRTDLAGPGGAKLPASAIDVKTVKVWFQPAGFWTTTWAGNIWRPEPIPALVLHDDTLVKVDYSNKVNYVRFDYTSGSIYTRMSGPDRTEWLNYTREPLADAEDYVPFTLEKGFYKQFWLTYHVPMDQKPGVYKGKLQFKSGALPVGELALELEVYPFSLPSARTHYDSSRPYMYGVMNGCSVAAFLGEGADLKVAEKKAFNTYKLMADHNITHPHGPGAIQELSTDDFAVRSLYLMRAAGLPCKPLFAAGTVDMKDPTDEDMEKYAKRMRAALDKYLGHHDAYYYGIDEAKAWLCRKQYGQWSVLKKHGQRIISSYGDHGECGWSIDCCNVPAGLGCWSSYVWHRDGGIATSYAAPFTGPECPTIWRRTKGLRFYYSDFDGFSEYVFYYHARNRWNEFIPSNDGYRSFGLVYPSRTGMIGTVALEALREGMDDVRYLSLLRLRAEAAMKSDKKDVRVLGRKAICWMDAIDPEHVLDLDKFRREVAKRVIDLVAVVGPQPDEPAVKPIGELPPHKVDLMAADESKPIQKRLDACVAANRLDLAIPLATRMRKEAETPAERATAAVREAGLRVQMLDRAGALAVLDASLKERGRYPAATYGRLMIEKAMAYLTPAGFCEHFGPEKLAIAKDQLAQALAIAGVEQSLRYSSAHRMCLALLNSDHPESCLEFARKCGEDFHLSGHSYGTLLYTGVEAYLRAGKKKEAYKLLKEVKNLGGGNLTGDVRTISGTLGELAEGFGEYEQAVIYYSDGMKSWPPNNDVYYPRYKAGLARVSRKATKTRTVKSDDNVMESGYDVDIKLDED
ncbi:MAG: hypothetical protein MJ138_01295 [Kiritimatiellae bacterium]|nr:hypothetical protein [Kiritimatiellia bacterium]